MRIRIDRDPRSHIPIGKTMVSICGVRALVQWRYVTRGTMAELCEDCERIAAAQLEEAATNAAGEQPDP